MNMDQNKVFFIALKDSYKTDISPLHFSEALIYIDWINKLNSANPMIISAPTNLCISFSRKLTESLQFPISILNSLSEEPPTKSEISEGLDTLPDSLYPNKIEPLLNFAKRSYSTSVIIIDESLFSTLKLDCSSRPLELSSYHEVVLQDENLQKIETSILKTYQTRLFAYIEEKTKDHHEAIAEGLQLVKSQLTCIPEEVKVISRAIDGNFKNKIKEFLKIVEKKNEETTNLLLKVNQLQQLVKYYKELADFYVVDKPCGANARVRIKSVKIKGWRFELKIVNESDEDLKDIKVFISESNVCVVKLKIMQRFSCVSLDLDLDEKDFYRHLVVICGDSVVSEPFTIFPIRIERDKCRGNNEQIRIYNLTNKQVKEIRVASINSIDNLMYLQSGLLPKKSMNMKIPQDALRDTILLISDGHQASNLLVLQA